MKLNNQSKYFINGLFLLVLGIFTITHLPGILKEYSNVVFGPWVYYQAEFIFLWACAVFFLFSPKYYNYQVLSICLAGVYYFLFVKFS